MNINKTINNKKIIFVNDYINKTIILLDNFIDKCHDVLSCDINYLITYDEMYKILYKRNKYKNIKMSLEKILLKEDTIKLYIFDRLYDNKELLLDYKELDKIMESNYKYYIIFNNMKEYIYIVYDNIKENIYIVLCVYISLYIIYKLYYILGLY